MLCIMRQKKAEEVLESMAFSLGSGLYGVRRGVASVLEAVPGLGMGCGRETIRGGSMLLFLACRS